MKDRSASETEICSHGVLLGVLAEAPGRFDLLLVTNPEVDPPEGVQALARRMLHLQFEDHWLPRPGRCLPTEADVQQALEWSAGGGDLVVSCHAGVSRSSALAYVIRCRDWSPQEATEILTRGWHRPNELIVRLGAALLGNPAVHEIYQAWLGEGATPPTPSQPDSAVRKRRKR